MKIQGRITRIYKWQIRTAKTGGVPGKIISVTADHQPGGWCGETNCTPPLVLSISSGGQITECERNYYCLMEITFYDTSPPKVKIHLPLEVNLTQAST